MFQLDGVQTEVSRQIQSLLDLSQLFKNPTKKTSLTCVVYRQDPFDRYLFLTAFAGLREIEPMFGPIVEDDRRLQQAMDQHRDQSLIFKPHQKDVAGIPKPNKLGFAKREDTKWSEPYVDDAGKNWMVWISGRDIRGQQADIERFQEELLYPHLKPLLDAAVSSKPLYPILWYHERKIRDRLHNRFRDFHPGPKLYRVGDALADVMEKEINDISDLRCNVGIYLDTGDDWVLLGDGLENLKPAVVKRKNGGLNAFEWVSKSTRPVLLRNNGVCDIWRQRILQCGLPDSRSYCIVPLLDQTSPWRSIGIVLLTTESNAVYGAHLFLVSRLSVSLSAHLNPLFPVPGFPWWPEVWVGVDATEHRWTNRNLDLAETEPDGDVEEPINLSKDELRSIVEESLPSIFSVDYDSISKGMSGTNVYTLKVSDRRRLFEIPRVLKVGREELIADEVRRYYKYVHNKRLGMASRIHDARVRRFKPGSSDSLQDSIGSIIYTLVGFGDEVLDWDGWAKSAKFEHVQYGLDLLQRQLLDWYQETKTTSSKSAIELTVKPWLDSKRRQARNLSDFRSPSYKEVAKFLRMQKSNAKTSKQTYWCVVHGDLHSRNLFALFTDNKEKERISEVAIIDWGRVSDCRHPLTDIARLIADLLYKVTWEKSWIEWESQQKGLIDILLEWESKLIGHDDIDWLWAIAAQIATILFWREADGNSYLWDDAREQAFDDLKKWFKEYGS